MLVETKARAVAFSIALGAYLLQFPQMAPELESQYEEFKATLPDTVEIVDGGWLLPMSKPWAQATSSLICRWFALPSASRST